MATKILHLSTDAYNNVGNVELLQIGVITCNMLFTAIHDKVWTNSPTECSELHKYRILALWYLNWIREKCVVDFEMYSVESITISCDVLDMQSRRRHRTTISLEADSLKHWSHVQMFQCVVKITDFTMKKFQLVCNRVDDCFLEHGIKQLKIQGQKVRRCFQQLSGSSIGLCPYRTVTIKFKSVFNAQYVPPVLPAEADQPLDLSKTNGRSDRGVVNLDN